MGVSAAWAEKKEHNLNREDPAAHSERHEGGSVFDRYSKEAQRALFFARQAVSDYGGTQLEPEHLLLGLERAAPNSMLAFVSGQLPSEAIQERMIAAIRSDTRVQLADEVRFSKQCHAALERAQIEADDLSDDTIRPEHVVLGIFVKTATQARAAMIDAGIDIRAIRTNLATRDRSDDLPPTLGFSVDE